MISLAISIQYTSVTDRQTSDDTPRYAQRRAVIIAADIAVVVVVVFCVEEMNADIPRRSSL